MLICKCQCWVGKSCLILTRKELETLEFDAKTQELTPNKKLKFDYKLFLKKLEVV